MKVETGLGRMSMETDRPDSAATEVSTAEVPPDPASTSPSRPSTMMAVVLNVLVFPLGHLHLGELRRGVYIWIATLALRMIAAGLVLLVPGRQGLIAGGVVLLATIALPIVDVVILALADRWRERSRPRPGWQLYAISLLVTLVVNWVATGLLRASMIQAFRNPSESMAPALQVGDFFFINKTPLARSKLRRGDIVAFQYPDDPKKDFVKRIIGLPNEIIEVRNKQVFVNGRPLHEPYAAFGPDVRPAGDPRDHLAPVRIPQNEFFVMGDNRDNSNDSRYWGALSARLIKGRAHVIYWSWDEPGSKARWERIGSRL